MAAHRACLPEPTEEQSGQADTLVATPEESLIDYLLARRHRERHKAIHHLLSFGRPRTEIARELGISTRTVHRFANTTLEEQLGKAEHRASSLDRFKDHLHRRWNDGVRNAAHLHRELQALGWRGSQRTIERYIRHLRALDVPASTALTPPKPRRVAGWIMSDPEHLSTVADSRLTAILARCPELAGARHHVGSFANMIQNLGGEKLPQWVGAVRADDLPALHAFAASIARDQDAVTAGLTLPWSNGPTEGTVNRLLKCSKGACTAEPTSTYRADEP